MRTTEQAKTTVLSIRLGQTKTLSKYKHEPKDKANDGCASNRKLQFSEMCFQKTNRNLNSLKEAKIKKTHSVIDECVCRVHNPSSTESLICADTRRRVFWALKPLNK